MRRAFVTLSGSGRQVHYRCAGSGAPLVLLHATPDSSAALDLSAWADRAVFAPDLPGYGESDPLELTDPSVADYTQALAEWFDALGLERAEVAGWGTGASIAQAFASAYPQRVISVHAHDPHEQAQTPSLAPEWDGTHLVRAWMIRRDMHLFRPWFARTPAARLPADLPSPDQLHREFLDLLRASRQPAARDTGVNFSREYADVSFGQIHLWRAGPRGGVPLLMLHASPGSSRGMLPVARMLATERQIVAMDTPGFGDSDPLLEEDPSIGDFADAVVMVMKLLGHHQVDLYGTHTGASIALEAATRARDRVRRIVFDGLPMFSAEERADHLANYIPPFEVNWDGSHVVWAWNFIRNMTLFYPWYHMDAQHATPRAPDTALLHERVVDLMKAGPNYAKGYRAVYRYDPRPALSQLSAPAMLCVSHEDVLAHHAEAVRQTRPDVHIEWLQPGNRLAATAASINAFLA